MNLFSPSFFTVRPSAVKLYGIRLFLSNFLLSEFLSSQFQVASERHTFECQAFYCHDVEPSDPALNQLCDGIIHDLGINENMVEDILATLNVNPSVGSDGIPSRL